MTRQPAPQVAALVLGGIIGFALPAAAHEGPIERRPVWECRLDMSCNAAAATLYHVLQAERRGGDGRDANAQNRPDAVDLLAQGGNADAPIDLFDEADPVDGFADDGDAGAPIDLSKDGSPTEPTDLFADPGGSSASDDAVESQLLRCAAGFGCEGTPISESDAQVLTDMTREQAGDAYAEKYPDAYIEDAFSDGSAEGSEPIDLFAEEGGNPVDRFPDAGDAGEPIDLFKETDPVDRFPDPGDTGEPIDLSREGEADSPIDLFAEEGANPVDRFPDAGDAGEPIDLFRETDPVERFPDEGEAGAPIDLSKDTGADEATDLFEEANPVDRFPDPGDTGEPIDLSREGEADSPIDLFDEEGTDPVDRFPDAGDAGEPIDLFKGDTGEREPETAGRPSDETDPADSGSTAGGLPDFAAMEGFATSPCPGTAFEWPDFMHMAGHKVATCQEAANGRFGGCGQPAANLFCLTNGYRRAACFGVGTAARALNAGVYCTGGACSAFSFIVCE